MKIPKEAQELFNKANEHIDNKEFEKALGCLNRALEIEPNYAEAMSKLGYIHYRLDYKKMSKEEVFNLSKKALDLNPKSPIVWRYMGLAYNNKKEYDKAIECYKKAIELDPNNAYVWRNMGSAYKNKKEYIKAIECHKKAVELDPNYVDAWYSMGNAYYDKNEYDKAIECYKKAIELDPNYVSAWYNMGLAYKNKKEYDKAIECYKKALEIDPNDTSAWLNIGVAYKNKKEYDKAIECYEKAVEIDPNSDISKKIEYGFYQNFREKQAILRKKYPDLDLTNYKDFLEKSEVIEDPIVEKFGILFLIPFSIQNTIRKTILELGVKYNRLQIAEIAEKCGELEDCIILVTQDMIENKDISAEYFKSTKSLVFDQQANIEEIDKLMEQYKQWEEEGISKK